MAAEHATVAAKQMLRNLSRVGTAEYVQHMSSKLSQPGWHDGAPSHSWAHKLLNLPGFDYCMGGVILVNLLVMVVETDQSVTEDDDASNTLYWTELFGWLVLLIFVLELAIRIKVLRRAFFKDAWNVFDFIIVVTDAFFSVIALIVGDLFPVSILRMFRLAKLARVSKVLRVFPELRLLLAGLLSAFSVIFWGTMLLVFFLIAWSMVAVLFIHPLNKDLDYSDCERCPRAYSSVFQATLTFWQQIVTGDSWGQASIPLIEKHPSTAFFFIPVFLSVGMAVMNLILGVVVSVAESAKDEVRSEEDAEKVLFKLENQIHLFEICEQLDTDHSGMLTREEIYKGLEEPGAFQENILALDISKEDFDIAFALMDTDRSGTVSYKEFVSSLCKMKSSDTQFMLAYIKCYITEIRNVITHMMEKQHEETIGVERKMENEIDKIERDEELILAMAGQQKLHVSEESPQPSNQEQLPEVVGLQISPGEEKLQSPSKCVSLSATVNNAMKEIQSPSGAASPGILSKNTIDETQVWLKDICHEIGSMRVELKDILLHVNSQLSPAVLPVPQMQQGKMKPAAHADLLVVPDKKTSCTLMCCTNPQSTDRRMLSPLPETLSAQGPPNAPALM